MGLLRFQEREEKPNILQFYSFIVFPPKAFLRMFHLFAFLLFFLPSQSFIFSLALFLLILPFCLPISFLCFLFSCFMVFNEHLSNFSSNLPILNSRFFYCLVVLWFCCCFVVVLLLFCCCFVVVCGCFVVVLLLFCCCFVYCFLLFCLLFFVVFEKPLYWVQIRGYNKTTFKQPPVSKM